MIVKRTTGVFSNVEKRAPGLSGDLQECYSVNVRAFLYTKVLLKISSVRILCNVHALLFMYQIVEYTNQSFIIIATLQNHCCTTSPLLLHHCCTTAAPLLHHYCALLLHHCCTTLLLLQHYRTNAAPLLHYCCTTAAPLQYH